MIVDRFATTQEEITICIVGQCSAGKSSFLNSVLGLNICETNAVRTTGCICEFVVNRELSSNISQINSLSNNWKSKIREKNKNNSTQQTAENGFDKIPNIPLIFRDKALPICVERNVILIDTPGLNESNLSQEAIHDFLKSKPYESIKKSVESANVVMYLVEPSRIDDRATVFLYSAISQANTDIMIVLTKADDITMDVNEQADQESKRVVDFAEIKKQIEKLENSFNCPVVAVSTKPLHNEDPEHTLSIKNAMEIACKYTENKPEYLKIKDRIHKELVLQKLVPVRAYNSAYQEFSKRLKIGGVIAGLSTTLGVAAIVGGALIFAIPVIGTGGGAAAITSGLAFLGAGNGMLAGIGVLGGIALSSGATSGIIVASSATVASTLVASSLALNILNQDTVGLPTLTLAETAKAQIEKYILKAKKAKFDSGWNAQYMPKYYNDKELYYDAIFVVLEEEMYCVQGCFEQRELRFIQNIQKVEFEQE